MGDTKNLSTVEQQMLTVVAGRGRWGLLAGRLVVVCRLVTRRLPVAAVGSRWWFCCGFVGFCRLAAGSFVRVGWAGWGWGWLGVMFGVLFGVSFGGCVLAVCWVSLAVCCLCCWVGCCCGLVLWHEGYLHEQCGLNNNNNNNNSF